MTYTSEMQQAIQHATRVLSSARYLPREDLAHREAEQLIIEAWMEGYISALRYAIKHRNQYGEM